MIVKGTGDKYMFAQENIISSQFYCTGVTAGTGQKKGCGEQEGKVHLLSAVKSQFICRHKGQPDCGTGDSVESFISIFQKYKQ